MVRLQPEWLPALAIYLAVISGLHLAWEVLQLPLYTIWTTGSLAEQVFAVVHCTGGDLMIALSSLVAAWLLTWAGRLASTAFPARGDADDWLLASRIPPSASGSTFMSGSRGPIRTGCRP